MKKRSGQELFIDCFNETITSSGKVDIAVGYVSKVALQELDDLVARHNVSDVSLIIGMYYVEGMPEGTYHVAVALAEKWKNARIGTIRIVQIKKSQ